jgi:hypothetical protein
VRQSYVLLTGYTKNHVARERREHIVFKQLLQMIPGLQERLVNGSEEDLLHVADLVSPCLAVRLSRS